MNRKVFFDFIRNLPFGGKISPEQFDGLTRILDYKESRYPHWDTRWLAYLLATVFHETDRTMQPITERGSRNYLRGKKYWPWIGRGLVQLTWEYNYTKYGLTDPKQALEWDTALRIAFDGMENGVFTGRKLSQFFNKSVDNPKGARKIINGTDKDTLIAVYYQNFLDALTEAEKAVESPQEVRKPEKNSDKPDVPELTKDPLTQAVTGIAGTGILTNLISAVSNPWALGAVVVLAIGLGIFIYLRKKQANATGV